MCDPSAMLTLDLFRASSEKELPVNRLLRSQCYIRSSKSRYQKRNVRIDPVPIRDQSTIDTYSQQSGEGIRPM